MSRAGRHAGGALAGLAIAAALLWFLTVQPIAPVGDARETAVVDPGRLESHVSMLAETLVPRDLRHPDNLDRAARYIAQELGAAGGRLSEQPYRVQGITYRNVIASFGPETDERIVVGAHYDTHGPLPGADDNASGVAGLIELGGLLGRTELPLRVDLVAYTLEELPIFSTAQMGSAVHARALREAQVPVRLMISLEMIGYFRDEPGSQGFPFAFLRWFYPSEGNFIAIVGRLLRDWQARPVKRAMRRATSLPVHSIHAPRALPGVDFSDHLNFWNAGYSALMITDTALYRNPNYHTAGDLPETLDYERMAQVVQGVYAAVLAIAVGADTS